MVFYVKKADRTFILFMQSEQMFTRRFSHHSNVRVRFTQIQCFKKVVFRYGGMHQVSILDNAEQAFSYCAFLLCYNRDECQKTFKSVILN